MLPLFINKATAFMKAVLILLLFFSKNCTKKAFIKLIKAFLNSNSDAVLHPQHVAELGQHS